MSICFYKNNALPACNVLTESIYNPLTSSPDRSRAHALEVLLAVPSDGKQVDGWPLVPLFAGTIAGRLAKGLRP